MSLNAVRKVTPAARSQRGLGDSLAKPELARKFRDNAVRSLPEERRQLPLPDCVGQVGHPLRRLRADRLQGHAARVHALEQADSGAEQHG